MLIIAIFTYKGIKCLSDSRGGGGGIRIKFHDKLFDVPLDGSGRHLVFSNFVV